MENLSERVTYKLRLEGWLGACYVKGGGRTGRMMRKEKFRKNENALPPHPWCACTEALNTGGSGGVWKESQSSLGWAMGDFSRLPLIVSREGTVKGAGPGGTNT